MVASIGRAFGAPQHPPHNRDLPRAVGGDDHAATILQPREAAVQRCL